jgi:hypothetical protein
MSKRTLSVEELPVLGAAASSGKAEHSRGDAGKGRERGGTTEGIKRRSQARLGGTTAAPLARLAAANKRTNQAKFDAAGARRALASAVAKAQFCAAERANGAVIVTYAPTGSVAGVALAHLKGDDVRKGCVVRAFRGARISPFQGEAVTVQKSFRLR